MLPRMPASQIEPPLIAAEGALLRRFRDVRARTDGLSAPLSAEDAMVQSMPDASPAKWHLAHTTWFFERFVLGARDGYAPVDERWDFLFNSYYNSLGPMHARPQRGLLSRPSLDEVRAYRAEVDARVLRRLEGGDLNAREREVLLLGTHHEQQHQELLLTDIKHALWRNPLGPAYRDDLRVDRGDAAPLRWHRHDESVIEIGALQWPAHEAFAFDNESPRHRALVPAMALASRTVTNAEYRAFIDDGGYREPGLWLSDGWALLQAEGWRRPLYWHEDGAREFTLGGWREIDPQAPACHLSYFEADAFARWAGARLPTEAEWERAAATQPVRGNFVEDDRLHPMPARDAVDAPHADAPHAGAPEQPAVRQLFGDVWEWTMSAYTAYPGFDVLPGALGEYNGKFMNGQWVLRGGSCASPRDHLRASYRTFFPPHARWQFAGIRLAKDLR
jgi:ergothioneine biosynthesis protein EgtB